jgi:exonuclease III
VNGRYVPELSAMLKERGMKIFHQNVRGLFSNKTYVQKLLHTFGKGIDILTMSETHVCVEDAEPLFDIPGYDFVSKARLTGKGGGVADCVSDNITWIRRNDLEDEAIECIWLEIILKHAKNVLIGIVYRPPDSSNHLCSNFNYAFSDMLLSVTTDGKEALLLGDCNINYLVKEDNAF